MFKDKIIAVKERFGQRLRAFRKEGKLSQLDFAELMSVGKNYISELEAGSASPSLDTVIKYAAFFGVEYYELGNPKYPVPKFEQFPKASRAAIIKLRERQQAIKAKAAEAKAQGKEAGVSGRAKRLHGLIDAGFFNRSKTARETFAKLNPKVKEADYPQYNIEIIKITSTLSSGRFIKLLDKLEPTPGTTAVRFVIKDPSVVKYLDGHAGTKDMAADAEER